MAPALGPRLTRLWKRLHARATAARLEGYVNRRPDAPDFGDALGELMELYGDGPLQHWVRPPADIAPRLATVSELALQRFPEGPRRASALVGLALARNAERDKRGDLTPAAAEAIRAHLEAVLDRHPDAPVAVTAAVGLIRTDVRAARTEQATTRYRALRDARAGTPFLERLREELGVLALRLGGVPEFHATTLDGREVGSAGLQGKIAVIDFWATWCPPCLEGFPALRRIEERHGGDVVLLGVNLDSGESLPAAELRRWIESRAVPGSQLYDGQSWESKLVKRFGVREIPFTVVVGPDGTVLAVNEHGKRLEKAVQSAVRQRS